MESNEHNSIRLAEPASRGPGRLTAASAGSGLLRAASSSSGGQSADSIGKCCQPVEPAVSGARADSARPREVAGPGGLSITMESLPPPDTRRWVVRRKAEVIAAIRGGLLTAAEACARYRLSPEELELWQESLDRAGIPGLRVTRIQLYRDYPVKPAVRESAPAAHDHFRDLSRNWAV